MKMNELIVYITYKSTQKRIIIPHKHKFEKKVGLDYIFYYHHFDYFVFYILSQQWVFILIPSLPLRLLFFAVVCLCGHCPCFWWLFWLLPIIIITATTSQPIHVHNILLMTCLDHFSINSYNKFWLKVW